MIKVGARQNATALLLCWLATGRDQARTRAALDSVLPFDLCWRRWFGQLQSADKFRQTLDRLANKVQCASATNRPRRNPHSV
jgi:hypothetical protein